MFAAACYLIASALIGAAVATVYWRNRFADTTHSIESLTAQRDHWRNEASINAAQLQSYRRAAAHG